MEIQQIWNFASSRMVLWNNFVWYCIVQCARTLSSVYVVATAQVDFPNKSATVLSIQIFCVLGLFFQIKYNEVSSVPTLELCDAKRRLFSPSTCIDIERILNSLKTYNLYACSNSTKYGLTLQSSHGHHVLWHSFSFSLIIHGNIKSI